MMRRMGEMKASEAERAVAAAIELASGLNSAVRDVTIVGNSNKIGLRLLPCDGVARVAVAGREGFESELEIARLLAGNESPVASLEPRVEPRVYERDGFAVTLWRFYEQSGREVGAWPTLDVEMSPPDEANSGASRAIDRAP